MSERRISIRGEAGIYQVNLPDQLARVASKLIDEPWRYFTRPEGTFLQAVETLVQGHVRWDGVERAVGYMRQAHDGEIDRRPPLTVTTLEDGRYLVVDGNSTLTVAIAAGWAAVACLLDSEDSAGQP